MLYIAISFWWEAKQCNFFFKKICLNSFWGQLLDSTPVDFSTTSL